MPRTEPRKLNIDWKDPIAVKKYRNDYYRKYHQRLRNAYKDSDLNELLVKICEWKDISRTAAIGFIIKNANVLQEQERERGEIA